MLDFAAFVRTVSVDKGTPHAFFLGAGASVSSGVPSAYTCLWQWKREIVRTEEPELERQLGELSLPSVRRRIQRWLDAQGFYPPEDDPDEYGFYAEECYPLPDARRQYFQNLVAGVRPSPGYCLLCLMAEAGVVESVWTTNFDGLVGKAAVDFDITAIEVTLDAPERVSRPRRRGELMHVALHGDFRYDPLKNTPKELRDQDATLRRAMVERLADTDLIVAGYSGRDESVMEALRAAYSQGGTGRLFWCGYGDEEPPDRVRRLIETARSNGREAYYVPAPGFDELAERLALGCLPEEDHARVRELRASRRADERNAPFTIREGRTLGLIKSNAFAVECPSEVLQFDWKHASSEGAWRLLRERTNGKDVVAALLRRKVLALGTIDGVKDAFAGEIEGAIERTPIEARELGMPDGVVVGLLTEGITRALAATCGLGTDGRRLLWVRERYETRRANGIRCRVHEAVLLFLRRHGKKQHLVLMPTIRCTDGVGEDLPREVEKELKRSVLSAQYNNKFNDALDRWRKRLFSRSGHTVEFPPEAGSTFRYGIRPAPNFAKITGRAGRTVKIPQKARRLVEATGIEIDEPELLFSNRRGDGNERDVNPVRGLLENRPYDFPLNASVLGDEIRLGVVCPPAHSRALAGYLEDLRQDREVDSKEEYLLDYPGFDRAFGIPLDLPGRHNSAWADCSEPDSGLEPERAGPELGRRIVACVDALRASVNPNVVMIFVPQSWAQWERFETDDQRFDLHDFVKAACVQRGVATQFLRERTLKKAHQGEILWWLALSCYVKAMRTPWVLAEMDPDLAFLGLGFSLDPGAGRGRQVLMGCSHVYNAEGLGLSYKLNKLESSVMRRGNPFLSRGDARRMAENALQLFFESRGRMPGRVVVHKNSPIAEDERRGLLEGLGEVSVDMLEITHEPALRYVASRIVRGEFQGDGFPVRRGTVVALDGQRALAWVHGTVDAVEGRRRYYQGKSRIPAPLMLKRHHGTTVLPTLAEQILGLSKMDWNSLDLYTKVPTTLRSSNQIARIGGLLDRLGANSYDYRLFI